MKSVFFNSIGGTTARSSFSAETPSQLIDCYLVFAAVRGAAKFKGCRNCGASASYNGNFDRLLFGQVIFLARSNSHLTERNIQHTRDNVNCDNANPHKWSFTWPAAACGSRCAKFGGYANES